VRGNGVGYASGMGRAAAIIGPFIASYLLAAKLPLQTVLGCIAGPYLVVAAVCLALDRIQRRMTASAVVIATPNLVAAPAPLRSTT
jgi:hypothetical protein